MGVFESAKGKAKEVVADVTDDDQLKAEGSAQADKGEAETEATKARAEAKAHETEAAAHEKEQKAAEDAS